MGETVIHYLGENFNQPPTRGLHHPLRVEHLRAFSKENYEASIY